MTEDQVEGINPVIEALSGKRQVKLISVIEGAEDRPQLMPVIKLAAKMGVEVRSVSKSDFRLEALTDVHQGIIAKTEAYPYEDLNDLIDKIDSADNPMILILDHITDPHNFGAVIRSADAAGVFACIVTRRHAPPITPAVAKASAGAVEHVRICRVGNLVQAMQSLKKCGLWFIGADADAEHIYSKIDMTGPIALVLGSEGRGLSRLVKKHCDWLAAIPMAGSISSLNVSVAGSIILFEARRQRLAREL